MADSKRSTPPATESKAQSPAAAGQTGFSIPHPPENYQRPIIASDGHPFIWLEASVTSLVDPEIYIRLDPSTLLVNGIDEKYSLCVYEKEGGRREHRIVTLDYDQAGRSYGFNSAQLTPHVLTTTNYRVYPTFMIFPGSLYGYWSQTGGFRNKIVELSTGVDIDGIASDVECVACLSPRHFIECSGLLTGGCVVNGAEVTKYRQEIPFFGADEAVPISAAKLSPNRQYLAVTKMDYKDEGRITIYDASFENTLALQKITVLDCMHLTRELSHQWCPDGRLLYLKKDGVYCFNPADQKSSLIETCSPTYIYPPWENGEYLLLRKQEGSGYVYERKPWFNNAPALLFAVSVLTSEVQLPPALAALIQEYACGPGALAVSQKLVIPPRLDEARQLRIDVSFVLNETMRALEIKRDDLQFERRSATGLKKLLAPSESTIENIKKQLDFLFHLNKSSEKSFSTHIAELLQRFQLNEKDCDPAVKAIIAKLRQSDALIEAHRAGLARSVQAVSSSIKPYSSQLLFAAAPNQLSEPLFRHIHTLYECIGNNHAKWGTATVAEILIPYVGLAMQVAQNSMSDEQKLSGTKLTEALENVVRGNIENSLKEIGIPDSTRSQMIKTIALLAMEYRRMSGTPQEKQRLIMDWITEIAKAHQQFAPR